MVPRISIEESTEDSTERPYNVNFKSRRIEKAANRLPQKIKESFAALLLELQKLGPARSGWPHYGKLTGTRKGTDRRHCHLRGGSKPTYVVCWEVLKDGGKIEIEIYYVGSHENAPY